MNSETMSDKNEETPEIAPETQENSEQPENQGYIAKIKGFFTKALSIYRIFLTTIIPLCVLLLFAKVVYELVQNDLIVKPFDVPKELEEQGYSGTVIVNKLLDYMGEIKRDLKEEREKEDTYFSDSKSAVNQEKNQQSNIQLEEVGEEQNVAVPGTGLSLEAIISHVRDLLNISPRYIKGDIVIDRKLLREDELRITIRITGKPFKTFKDRAGNLESLLKQAAKYLLMNLEPLALGMEYCESDNDEELESLIRYIRKNNSSPHEKAIAFILQGCLLQSEDSEIALTVLKKATELDPENATAFYIMGNILSEQEKYEEAIVQYEKVLELGPTNIDIYMVWGEMLIKLKQFKEAEEKFKTALKISPENAAQIYTNWGISLFRVKERESAEEKFKIALKEDPNYTTAHVVFGYSLARKGKFEEASIEYQKVAELEI